MKRIRLLIIMIILTIVLGVYAVQPVAAVPQLPSSFWGSVTLDGSPVPAGTAISARINGNRIWSYHNNPGFGNGLLHPRCYR